MFLLFVRSFEPPLQAVELAGSGMLARLGRRVVGPMPGRPAALLARSLLPVGSLGQRRGCASAAVEPLVPLAPATPPPTPTAPSPIRPPSFQPTLADMPPPPSRFAVVELGGTQYKVAADDVIAVEKLKAEVGSIIHVNRVLLVASKDATIIGSPLVKDATVEAVVEEQTLADKVIVFKKKRRKGYRRWKGHRQPLTLLRINDINLPPGLNDAL